MGIDFGFGMDDPDEYERKKEEDIANLTPEDALIVACSTFAALAGLPGQFLYPSWEKDCVLYLHRMMTMEGSSLICSTMIQLCAIAISVTSQLAYEAREEAGEEQVKNEHGQEQVTPAELLAQMVESCPIDYQEDVVDKFKEMVKERMYGGSLTKEDHQPENKITNDQVQEMKDLFNLPSQEDSPDA